jgi:hypothetical protein
MSFSRHLLDKIQRVNQKVPFDPVLRGRLGAMAIKVRVVLDVSDGSDEKIGINYASHVEFYHGNQFMSLLIFC